MSTKLTAADGVAGDYFGISVALSGDTALVGAFGNANYTGAAYVYVRSGTVWTQQAKLTASDSMWEDGFGESVALSGDTALVGAATKARNTGAAYVYVRSGTVWTQQAKLTASDGVADDYFGISVALSGDTALVGANGDQKANYTGAAYVYVRSGTAANLTLTPTTGSAGVPLSLTGSGFAPNETLLFSYRSPSGSSVAVGTASADASRSSSRERRKDS